MDDTEDDARYPPNTVRTSDDYGSSDNQKRSCPDDEYEEDSDDEVECDDNTENGVGQIGKDCSDSDEDGYDSECGKSQKNQKKRKLKSLLSSYEFSPRVSGGGGGGGGARPKPPTFGGRNPLADWSEHETFILLEAWGDRFLKQGRKSLRSEEWQEVAKKVSQESKITRTDTQCRNRLDTLKKKYKKEKMKFPETKSATGRWVYFRKMDALLSCGVDSGEYTFLNPKSHLSRPNGMDEMRDSPGISTEVLPPKRTKKGQTRGDESSFKLLVDSIHKFSEIYEKIENSKTQQMVDLEKMRMEFHRELEAQKRQILERGKAEILKIRQGDYDENNVSGG